MAKTISAYADEATARLVETLARVEQRPVSQLASAALAFYVRLPAEAHAALRRIEALGEEGDLEQVARQVTRVMLDAQYEVAKRRAAAAMQLDDPDAESEAALLDQAVRLTARTGTAPRAPRSRRPTRR